MKNWNNLSKIEQIALVTFVLIFSPLLLPLAIIVGIWAGGIFAIYCAEKLITGKDPEWD